MVLRNLKNEAVLRIKVEFLPKKYRHKKWHGTQLKRFQGTGIPSTRISEPTP